MGKKKPLDEQQLQDAVEASIEEMEEAGREAAAEPAAPEPPKPEEEPLKDQFLRLQADFANFRNRTLRERNELYQRANEDFLLEILPVLDHFELGLQNAAQHQTDSAVVDGFKLVYDQFRTVLDKFNVKPINAVGESFDPHRHEALTHMPSDEYPAETCSQLVRRGYLLGDRLLRAAQVVVSSGPAQPKQGAGE
jgi:molecular chaperone GrpE